MRAAANPDSESGSRLQSARHVAAVAELGSLGAKEHFQRKERWITKNKQKKEPEP